MKRLEESCIFYLGGKKNNPILLGDPGVGKTAIVEGLAWRIVKHDVPENLKTKRIFALDMAALVAGAKYKGEFEERLKSLINEVVGSDGEVILFIDEIHTLIGTGGGQGAMDAANILKPALRVANLEQLEPPQWMNIKSTLKMIKLWLGDFRRSISMSHPLKTQFPSLGFRTNMGVP